MRIINANGTRSLLTCINPDCKKLPVAVLKLLLRGEYFETHVLYCEDDEAYAIQFVRKRYGEIHFVLDGRDWLKRKQEKEFTRRAIQDETQLRGRRRSED